MHLESEINRYKKNFLETSDYQDFYAMKKLGSSAINSIAASLKLRFATLKWDIKLVIAGKLSWNVGIYQKQKYFLEKLDCQVFHAKIKVQNLVIQSTSKTVSLLIGTLIRETIPVVTEIFKIDYRDKTISSQNNFWIFCSLRILIQRYKRLVLYMIPTGNFLREIAPHLQGIMKIKIETNQ